jgi:hypothetical protein
MDKASHIFEKIAVGPAMMPNPGYGIHNAIAAKYITAKSLLEGQKTNPQIAQELKSVNPKWKTEGLILHAPKGAIRDMPFMKGPEIERVLKRHELVHYMRHKRGQLPDDLGKPGIKGVATVFREEIAAHRASIKRAPKTVPTSAKVMSVVKGTMASAKEIYPQGILKAILRKGK